MKKSLFLICVATFSLFANEPSAFKAGDLDSPNPYGLTSSEKKIVEQNKNLQNISTKLFDTAQSQQELRNEIDGIKSLVEGHSQKIISFENKINGDDNDSLKTINRKLEENMRLQNENYDKIMSTLSALAALIDDTRGSFVSKEQLKKIVGKNYKEYTPVSPKKEIDINKSEPQAKEKEPQKDKVAEASETQNGKLDAEELFLRAQKKFRDNKLADSKSDFEILIKEFPKYKTPLVEYYMGEISYKNSDYQQALEWYQKSIESDEKASYVPIILYHTGVSLEKLGDLMSAKKIYKTLETNYPKHYLVDAAKKRAAQIK